MRAKLMGGHVISVTSILVLLSGCGTTPSKVAATDGGGEAADGGAVVPEPDAGNPVDAGMPAQDGGTTLACEGTNKLTAPRLPVVNGTRVPSHVPLDAAQQMAVVGLAFGGSTRNASCSGVLIADRIVLTARHCTRGETATSIYAVFGVDDRNPVLSVRVAQKREHGSHDVSLLTLSSSPRDSIDVRPIPIALEDLGGADIGMMTEQAGYGQTSTRGGSDGRFFVAEPLYGFESSGNVLVVDGQGQRGVCFGDSGGPSMRIAPAGDTRVIGVLSWGDDSCVGRDRYARTDYVRSWIEETTGPTPLAGPQPCGSVTAEGTCSASGAEAIYCGEDGMLQRVSCGSGQVCAWSPGAAAYRCVPAASDPCGGVTRYGTCEGGTLRWCDRDTLNQRNCNACGERCVLLGPDQGYSCVQSDCGDLSYQGRCQGSVAEWCNEQGQRSTLDCATRGQTCGFVNTERGYYCVNVNECGDLDYIGRCNGQIAEWCEYGRIRRRDCAARGQVCRYVDDQVGYTCANP